MKRAIRRSVWGLALIILGVGFLFNAMGLTTAHDFVIHWWPVLIMLLGVADLAVGELWNGLFWVVLGGVVLAYTTGAVSYHGNVWAVIWPLALVFIGLRFLFRPAFMREHMLRDAEFAEAFGGEVKKVVKGKDFKGSAVRAVFGGAKLDLRDAKVAKEGAVVDVSAFFGGVEILVPRKTPVRTHLVAIFGGHSDKRDPREVDESLPPIVIQGEVVFGGVEIHE